MTPRRHILLATPALILAGNAKAQTWPQWPVRIVVPFGLGGSTDVAGRSLAAMIRFAHAQGLAARDLTPEELFHPDTLAELA